MLIVSIILVLALLILIFVVNFVLSNLAMFQTPFDIIVRVPFTQWSHTWQGVEFMYILAGSVLLGALVIALSTWVLDTKRKLKLRSVRKELKRLQEDLKEAKSSLSKEEVEPKEEVSDDETTEVLEESPSATPEEISKSFEDAVEDGDFLEESPEEFEKEPTRQASSAEEDLVSNGEKQLPQETPVEAELVEPEELPTEGKTKHKEEKEAQME